MALSPLLELDLLRTLVFVAEEGTFTKAAQRVGRTQSGVTLQMQKLEALVGQPLVIRSKGGPVELTAQGRALVENARSLLVLGSSLTVMSGLRFVRRAAKLGIPVAIVNQGATRGDPLADLKVEAPLGQVLPALAD